MGETIKRIASSYVYYYSRKYGRDGHLFKERFKSVNTVLNRITFKELDEWVNDPLDDDVQCLEIEKKIYSKPSDDQIWLKIKDQTGVTNSTSFQQLDENKREEIFLELKDCGASLRQLERLTGIGKGVIHRIWCAGH